MWRTLTKVASCWWLSNVKIRTVTFIQHCLKWKLKTVSSSSTTNCLKAQCSCGGGAIWVSTRNSWTYNQFTEEWANKQHVKPGHYNNGRWQHILNTCRLQDTCMKGPKVSTGMWQKYISSMDIVTLEETLKANNCFINSYNRAKSQSQLCDKHKPNWMWIPWKHQAIIITQWWKKQSVVLI